MRHFTKEGQPLSCPRCKCPKLREDTKAIDGGQVSEFAVRCEGCEALVGYWAYGHWDPIFRPKTLRQALGELGQALRSLGRAILRNARGRV